MKTLLTTLIAVGILAFGSVANAATINYVLNLSNELADGPIYADVKISDDSAIAGAIDFNIIVNADNVFDLTNATNFGMQTFAFNYNFVIPVLGGDDIVLDGTNLEIVNIDPTEWTVRNVDKYGNIVDANNNVSEFGRFEFDLAGNGDTRTTSLSFSIIGVNGDGIGTYANSNDGSAWFASHIAGFADTACITEEGEGLCNSAYFAGYGGTRGLEQLPEVPIPAAAWLFGSGLIGLVGVARRKVTDNNA